MFRLWGKIYKNNKIINDTVVCIDNKKDSIESKVSSAVNEMCIIFDLQQPMWFSNNYKDIEQFKLTTFSSDHFIESIDFDYFEVEIIEEDDDK